MELAFAQNPNVAVGLDPLVLAENAEGTVTVSFVRPISPAAALTWEVETSADLKVWIQSAMTEAMIDPVGEGFERVTLTLLPGDQSCFVRLRLGLVE
jgi:hypothetical protein